VGSALREDPRGSLPQEVPSLKRLVVGITGATGSIYGIRLLEVLRGNADVQTHLVISSPGKRTIVEETAFTVRDVEALAAHHYDIRDIGASIASGSYPTAGMIVVPCSAGTLGSIANGISRGLLQRAADVCLKERRPLVLAFRESPYSLVHVENMRRVTEAGAIVAPPSPAFYLSSASQPAPMDRFLDAYCRRAARWLGLEIGGGDGDTWKGVGR
jgi:4-hydroxy-3-polyprenylbenzoate decarboxylase